MDIIKDISNVSSYRPSQGDLLKLFQLSIEQNVTKEEIRSQFSSEGYFRYVYKQLKDRLLDGILLNSFSGLTKIQQVHLRIRKRNLEAQMLILTEKKKAGIAIAEETYTNAEKYNLIDVAYELTRQLELHYATVQHHSKYKKYAKLVVNYEQLLQQEREAQSLFAELAYCHQNRNSIEQIPSKIEVLSKYAEENNCYRFRLFYYSVRNLYARIRNDRQYLIATCNEALTFFKTYPTILPYTTKWNFRFQLIPIYISLHDYAKAEISINESLALPKKGSYNWHLTLFYKVILGFYSQKPNIVLNARKQSKSITQKFDSKVIQDRWKLIEAYLALYTHFDLVHTPIKFRLRKFLNEVTTASPIQLLQIELLHLLINRKQKDYMKRVEAIPNYIQNHQPDRRTRCFLRMLAAIESGDYHPVRVSAHAKKQYHSLKKIPVTETHVNVVGTELIRYEILWELIMKWLKTKG